MRAGQRDSHAIGSQANVQFEWQLQQNVSCAFYFSHFLARAAVTEAGGRDVDFIGTWIALRFY